ncbi:MAG TPA: 4-(cytidine 5'-diphospho)-2-C-methyl-D-erythritol kinase [Steroidobacteraceae bacterium]|nr:4-(cytidine 5'-diphospho)-2-C-methyl-D-erythritol kinase [Steroidobacteraceae bacterium]
MRAALPGAESQWPAPAKLNLFLHVTARRGDGYHDLQTLFQLIDLADTIGITLRADGRIERLTGPADIPPETDLTIRAARALQAATGTTLGANLRVRKRIPTGGGLGGGSSDAATTLLALNHLWGTELSVAELAAIGLTLGSDVPLFVRGASAWAEGRGEALEPVELPERWYAIVHPRVHVATAAIFQAPELTRNSPKITMRAFFQTGGRNDCESIVRARFPEVAEALDWLARFAPARLTGTGACVFAEFERAIDAERVAARVPERWTGFVARGLNTSPVHERLGLRT